MKAEKIKKRIVIFSSSESLRLAKCIQAYLHPDTYTTRVWSDGFFKLSQSYIANFQDIQYEYDFAVVVCGADDMLTTRGKRRAATRDNVLLELGMCISSFTLNRVIIVKHKEVKLPSDLDGINPVDYTFSEGEDIDAIAGTICAKIQQHIDGSEYAKNQFIKLSWDEYFHCARKLFGVLNQSVALGGYEYDIIVGINRGGLMIADLISREGTQNVPVLPLFADRRSGSSRYDTGVIIDNIDVLNCIDRPNINNILLIDSFTRDGISVIEAKKYLQEVFPNKTIKSAVVYANQRLKSSSPNILSEIDYIGDYKNLDGKKLSLE